MRSVETGADASRVPPHDLDAERAVIGALLVSETAVVAVAEQLSPEDFYSETHRIIYGSMMRLYARGDRIDQITLTNELSSVNEFERVGGRAYVFQLVESVPTASNAARYAEIIRGKALLRSVIDVGSRITEDAFREPEDVTVALDSAEQLIYGVSNRTLKQHLAPVSELAPGALEMIQRLYEQEGEVTGVETGFEDLDRLTTGFHKSDLVVLAARPAMGKCLSADAEIVLHDGSVRTIEEIFQKQEARLLTLGDDLKLSWTRPSAFIDDGMKPVYEVKTRLGRTIKTTLTHPFLTMGGWRMLGELSVGDHVAVPRRMPVFGNEPLGTHRVKLLAYMLGDGNMTGGTPRFTNANPTVREDFVAAAEEFGGLRVRTEASGGTRTPTLCVCGDRVAVRRHREDFARTLRAAVAGSGRPAREFAGLAGVSPASVTNWSLGRTVPDVATALRLRGAFSEGSTMLDVSGLDRARKNVPNPLRRWLDGLGLWGRAAKDKFVPDSLFRASREELGLFLNRLFATDGWATVLASGQARLGYCSASEKLARQVQHLLLRFGVISSLRERSVKYEESRRPAFQLDITGAGSIRTFIEEIGIFGKEEAVKLVAEVAEKRHPHSNRDLVPREVWKLIDKARGTESWSSLAGRMGFGPGHNFHVGTRSLSRGRVALFAEALDDDGLRDLAAGDVYWDSIVSIEPRGIQQVYDLTVPETHNFVANDICVHNTAMALNAIWHAASEKKMPVAIFSLEMSKEQLVQRLISQTTRIPTQSLRSGNVKAEDWPKLLRGVAQVSEAPIWIDDTAGVSLMEMRAKVRRLASQLGAQGGPPLSLVVVDYLQLMIGQGSRNDNRQQEIAEISRGLKVLARDLDVPVLAIAQLSRAVESRHDKRPMLSDLRDCVTGDTLVLLADGRRVPVRELVGTTPRVLAMSPGGEIIEAESDLVWSVGRRPVFTVRLASGREVRATARHRLFGADGWIRVGELRPDDRLALARGVPEPEGAVEWPESRLALLGHLIGDGSYLSGQPMRHCTASEENSRIVAESAVEEFGVRVNRHAGRGNWHQLVLSGNGNRWHPAGVNLWLRDLGIFGQRSHEKRIPGSVFGLGSGSIATLLKHLWATDGTIFARKPGTRGSSAICFSANSRGLARDVAALLLRVGIVARLREVAQGRHRPMFTVSVSGTRDQRLFLERVGAFGPRRDGAQKLTHLLANRRDGTNVDTLPVEFFEKVKASMAVRGASHRAMSLARGRSYGGSSRFRFAPSRTLMAEYAGLLEDETLLADAESDLFWDRVIEVIPAGTQEVFDLTVPGPASWLADGIVSHNSGAIEQDADMVMFLYRDEYYNPDSDDKGIAEVIVGKHRNGPTGKVQLAWLEQYTKFASLARRG